MSADFLPPPLIYIESLSINGTFLKTGDYPEQRLKPKNGPILVNNGDVVRLALSTLCVFRFCGPDKPVVLLRESQLREVKAR
jgi:hypothetical protein